MISHRERTFYLPAIAECLLWLRVIIGSDTFPGTPPPPPGELWTMDEATWYTLHPEVEVGIDWTLSDTAPPP